MALTPREAAARIGATAKELTKVEIAAVRRVLGRVRTKAGDRARQRGVVRRLFGKKKSGLRALIKRERVRQEGGTIKGGLLLRGLVAIQETGQRTEAHRIRPKLRKALHFEGRRGPAFSRRGVLHPGSRMPRLPLVEDEMRRSQGLFRGEIDAAHRDLITQKLGR